MAKCTMMEYHKASATRFVSVGFTLHLQVPHDPPCTWTPDDNSTDPTSDTGVCSCGYNYDYEYAAAVLVLVIFVHVSKMLRSFKVKKKKGWIPIVIIVITSVIPLGWSGIMILLLFTGSLTDSSPLGTLLVYVVAGLLFFRCSVELIFSVYQICKLDRKSGF